MSDAADAGHLWHAVRGVDELCEVFRMLGGFLQDAKFRKEDEENFGRANVALVKVINAADLALVLEALLRLLGDAEGEGRKVLDAALAKAAKFIPEYLSGYQGERNLAVLLSLIRRHSAISDDLSKTLLAVVGPEKLAEVTRKLGVDENLGGNAL